MRWDYRIEYYTGEDEALAAVPGEPDTVNEEGSEVEPGTPTADKKNLPKQKGTIYPAGYEFVKDPESKDVKDKEHSVELHHGRRRCYFFQFDTAEEKEEWSRHLKAACDNAKPPSTRTPSVLLPSRRPSAAPGGGAASTAGTSWTRTRAPFWATLPRAPPPAQLPVPSQFGKGADASAGTITISHERMFDDDFSDSLSD
eukprot:gnl/Ergobibamus_cyprinoides/5677.p2 GENE.gnl/Ergobibamus_cyprinoides/5677~~gnl/Ergobibamus_cyprinoides/5677.p2  ORF type:complete len:199 (+),score=69.28 gnl/Ergobibamus_cyprinoides/5677:219-815(+)